jgi:apolipoprotein N-acyltransferase
MTIRNNEPTVRAIIAAARSAPTATRPGGAWLLSGLSGLLLWASFPPLDWGPLGWIALVPLLLLVRPAQRPRGTILATFVCGFVTELVMLQWLRYGDPAMYVALVALAFYLALYFPVFVLACRAAVHRFRVPLVIAAPTLWVGLEFVRAHLMTGFSWYYLGHTQYRWLELIQISDLVGAYGVSFVVAASSVALAVVLPRSILTRLRIEPAAPDQPSEAVAATRRAALFALGVSLSLVAASMVYGYVRRGQAAFAAGPRIALVQGNFTTKVKHDPAEGMSIFTRHYVMTGDAVKFQPDVIVWPETMYRDPLLIKSPGLSEDDLRRVAPFIPSYAWKSPHVPDLLHDLSRQAGAEMIIGIDTFVADADSLKHFNSAVLSEPATGIISRYDKIHRVAFGEYLPLRNVLPFLKNFVPYESGFGIDPGDRPVAFQCKKWRLAPVICFEDTVPHLVRSIVSQLDYRDIGGKPIDCLVNLTNDGWFDGSSGLDQHLISALFRCVECRKPMVRAVNTGISAVINGDGAVIEPEVFIDADNKGRNSMRDPKTGRWYRQLNEVLVDSVPLDNRTSLYVRYGDWFAESCGCALLLAVLLSMVPPKWLARRAPAGPVGQAASLSTAAG